MVFLPTIYLRLIFRFKPMRVLIRIRRIIEYTINATIRYLQVRLTIFVANPSFRELGTS
jgi:hypothetical protein